MEKTHSNRKFYLFYILMYAMYYVANATNSYTSKYFSSIGISKGMIGIIMSVSPFILLVAQPFWGTVGDKAKNKYRVLRIILVGAGLAGMAYLVSESLIYTTFIFAVYTFFTNPIIPTLDATTLSYGASVGFKYSWARITGTTSYAIASIFLGYVLSNDIKLMFPVLLIFSVLSAVFTYFLPTTAVPETRKRPTGEKVGWGLIFRNRELMLLVTIAVIVQMTLNFHMTYFPLFFTDDLGGSNAIYGWAVSMSSVGELPFLFFANKLYKKLGIKKLLIISACISGLRWLLFSTLQLPILAVFFNMLHGGGFIVTSFCLATYINNELPGEFKVRGQAFVSLATGGVARIIANLIGGNIYELLGDIRILYAVNSTLCFVVAVAFAVIFWRLGKVKKQAV